jgi:aspartyl-tRNA synthetase
MAWMKFVAPGSFEGPVSRFFDAEAATRVATALGAEPGDLLCFVADTRSVADAAMNNLRRHLGRELKLYDPATFHFAWVTDFPLFSWNEENQRYDSEHHPFTSPIPQDVEALKGDLTCISSASYDLVINGFEIASGSVRIHDPEVQREVFRILKISDEDIRERFGFFIDALQYGTPPHAGIAFGFDRLVALGLGQDSIRDVIAFPKNTRAMDMMNGAPSTVDEKQLVDLHIRVRLPDSK